MKRKLVECCRFAAGFALVAFGFCSCNDDPNATGLDILPGSDLTSVDYHVEVESNKAYTRKDTILRTDRLPYNVFGTFNDPVFGKTTADFACQFRLAKFPSFHEDAQLDSLILSFLYKDIYGDTVTTQTMKVYELVNDIYADVTNSSGTSDYEYYQDVDLKSLASAQLVGQLDFVPKFRTDSTGKDTLIQELRIPMSNELAEKLFKTDELDATNFNDEFINYFKGLYMEANDVSGEGSLVRISSISYGSKMTLYSSHHEIIDNKDSLLVDSVDFRINENSARISRFVHDYSQADFASSLENPSQMDSLIYLQPMGGLRVKLELPSLDDWVASVESGENIGVNKAELILQVDTVASNYPTLGVPDQILLTALTADGKEYFPSDLGISQALYGGYFYDDDNTYRFNITRHLQDLINKRSVDEIGTIRNNGFFLSTFNKENQASRVVLKGASSKVGIRLEVTYVKYN